MINTVSFHSTGMSAQVINPSFAISDDQMVSECTPLIYSDIHAIESEFGISVNDFLRDDLVQKAWEVICEARPNYNPSKGAAFTTYVHKAVFFAIWHALEDELERVNQLDYYDEQVEHDEIVEDGWTHIQADPVYEADYGYQSREAREECEERLSVLNSTDQWLVKEVYGLNDGFEHSYDSAAFTLGISPQRVLQRIDRAFKLLQAA